MVNNFSVILRVRVQNKYESSLELKKEKTHVVDEHGGVLRSLEDRSVAGVLEVASVFLKGGFVQSLCIKRALASVKCTFLMSIRGSGCVKYLTVQCLVLVSQLQLRSVPHVTPDALQELQVFFVFDLKTDTKRI